MTGKGAGSGAEAQRRGGKGGALESGDTREGQESSSSEFELLAAGGQLWPGEPILCAYFPLPKRDC